MAIVVGTNSYVAVAEADTYFGDRYGYESWAALDATVKEQALVSAFSQMNAMCEWYSVMEDPYPQDIKDAQCEIAFAITTTNSTSTDGGDPLIELKAGSVTLKFDAGSSGNPLVNDLTSSLLADYGMCSGSGSTKLVPMERQ